MIACSKLKKNVTQAKQCLPLENSLLYPKRKRVHVRRPEVMEQVEKEVKTQYQSQLVNSLKAKKTPLQIENTTLYLAKELGFCYGVDRAIDLAYATRNVFPDKSIYLIGEIIHNPHVNQQLRNKGIVHLPWREMGEEYDKLGEEDVVIVPAFGAPKHFLDKLDAQGCTIVDTTCGDVMRVWKRVRQFSLNKTTCIVHGKHDHEETKATISWVLSEDETPGVYLVLLTLKEAQFVANYIVHGEDKQAFLAQFKDRYSEGFDPDKDLHRIGMANQTTMLKNETQAIQNILQEAIIKRDGNNQNYELSDTICGATQDRQNALFELLKNPLDLLLIVGGYNSSNTTHLAEIAAKKVPAFFIRDAQCLKSLEVISHFDWEQQQETISAMPRLLCNPELPFQVAITAGASCPNQLIEETILRVLKLRGISNQNPVLTRLIS